MLILNISEDFLNSVQNKIFKKICEEKEIDVAFLYRNEIQVNQYSNIFSYVRQLARRMYYLVKRRNYIYVNDLLICTILQLQSSFFTLLKIKAIISDVRKFYNKPDKSYEIDGIQIGDLLIDTVIRFCQREQYSCSKRELFFFICKAHFYLSFSKAYFSRFGASDTYFTEYTTYLHHGIFARVARKAKLRVCTYGCIDRVYQEFDFESYSHAEIRGLNLYTPEVSVIEESERLLKNRMLGKAPSQLAYMRDSNLRDGTFADTVHYKSVDAIVFLHDFFDSTNIFKNFMYLDFYTWAVSVCDTLTELNKTFYIKGHPNQIAEGAAIIEGLRSRYPNSVLQPGVDPLSSKISFKVGITVYGSIAYELAYAGIPSIIFADAPYSKLSFANLLRRAEELESRFDEATQLAVSAATDAIYYQSFRHSAQSGDLRVLLEHRNRLKFANCEYLTADDEEIMKCYCNHIVDELAKGE